MNQALTMLLAAGVAASAHASITDHLLYQQASPSVSTGSSSVYYSNPVHDQIMYDQFQLDSDTSILGFGFWGALYNDAEITISIYEQDSQTGLLGSGVYEERFTTNTLNPQVSGSAWDELWFTDEHHAIAEFANPFSAQAGQSYWLSITGNSLFAWTFGADTGQNNTLYSDFDKDQFWTNDDIGLDPTNLAFSIYGTAVPAPSTVFTVMGALGFSLSRRRRSC